MEITLPLLIFIIGLSLLAVEIYLTSKYAEGRRAAFRSVEMPKVIAYFLPLIVSVIFVVIFYQTLLDYLGMSFLWLLLIGLCASAILFDVFESSKFAKP